MCNIFWKLVYNIIITPVLMIVIHLLSVISRKVRRGLYPRYRTIQLLKKWIKDSPSENKQILFHAASLGEFEHIKPLLYKFKSKYDTINIVTFFSPSGYINSEGTEYMDYRMYMPFDIPFLWRSLYGCIKPSLLIISKHDIWPVQIWMAKKMNIPIILLNASLSGESSRTGRIAKHFLSTVYHDLNYICAISEDDASRFRANYPDVTVDVIGDTKYDQVVVRRDLALDKNYLNNSWSDNKQILVAGSIWPEDELHLFPAVLDLLNRTNINVIFAPHEPNENTVKRIKNVFKEWKTLIFSEKEKLTNQRIIIVDSVGYLADIYRYASFAYLGGSFKQGIHNVMEAAIYGIPVLYGPVHTNSYEAIQLALDNGGIVVHNSGEILAWLTHFIDNQTKSMELGKKAEQYVLKNTGATDKILTICKKFIEGE